MRRQHNKVAEQRASKRDKKGARKIRFARAVKRRRKRGGGGRRRRYLITKLAKWIHDPNWSPLCELDEQAAVGN